MLRTMLILALLSLNKLSLAETASSQDYDLAQKALAKNDCQTAIKYLETYKAQNSDNLKKHPEFSSQIERQIAICSNQLKQDSNKKIIAAMPGDKDVAAMAVSKDAKEQNLSIKNEVLTIKNIKSSF